VTEVLRIHFDDGTFRDLPLDTRCDASEVGVLFTGLDGHLECWYRPGLINHVDRVPMTEGVTILPAELDLAGRL